MKKLSFILDFIILSVAISALSFCVFFAFFKSFAVTLVLCVSVYALFAVAFLAVSGKLETKNKQKTSDKELTENFKAYLLSTRESETTALFSKLFEQEEQKGFPDDFLFFDGALSEERFFSFLKKSEKPNVRIFCVEAPEYIKSLVRYFPEKQIEFFEPKDSLSLLIKHDLAPTFPDKPQSKVKFKAFLTSALKQTKCKGFCLIGIFLAAFSFFTPYKTLYLVFAGVLVVFSAILFFAKINIEKKSEK